MKCSNHKSSSQTCINHLYLVLREATRCHRHAQVVAKHATQRHALMQSMPCNRPSSSSSCQHGLRRLLSSPFSCSSRRSILGHLRLLCRCEFGLRVRCVRQRRNAHNLGFEGLELVFYFVFVLVGHLICEEIGYFLEIYVNICSVRSAGEIGVYLLICPRFLIVSKKLLHIFNAAHFLVDFL
jgi:hypothetical protein